MMVSAKTYHAPGKVTMNYSTLAQALAHDGNGVVFDLDSLYSRLRT